MSKEWLLWTLCIALMLTIFNTTNSVSGDTMKAVMCISICFLIGFVWWVK